MLCPGLRFMRWRNYNSRMTNTPDHRAGEAILIAVMIISLSMILPFFSQGEIPSPTRQKPPGYYDISQVVSDYPERVIKNGTFYEVISNLVLPASKQLYLGPGDELRFAEGAYLNLSAPPLFEGGEGNIILRPIVEDSIWGGINIYEADPTTTPMMDHIIITGARIGVRISGGADLSISNSTFQNCQRSGIEAFGPLSEGASITVSGCDLNACGNYGIHLGKVQSSILSDLNITECITGIRSFASAMELRDSTILDSDALGLSLVNSEAVVKGTDISESDEKSTRATNQVISLNSTLEMEGCLVKGGNQCMLFQRGSQIKMRDSSITDGFTDCIQAIQADLYLEEVTITNAVESAIHIVECTLESTGLNLKDNGRGTGSLVFSSIYMDKSEASLEAALFEGSGDAHLHLNSSRVRISNSTLNDFGNDPIILQQASFAEYVNEKPPSDVAFRDQLSYTRYSITPVFEVNSYITKEALENVQIDVEDREGILVSSSLTNSEGRTQPLFLGVYTNTTSGTMSRLPFRILATLEDYEVSVYDMTSPEQNIQIELYPPNEPPELNLISPVNGTIVEEMVNVQGYISDDLDIYRLRFRVDQGSYKTIDLESVDTNGYFTVDLDIGSLSKGEHKIWIHAFDGSHLSSPEIRSIISNTSGLDDTDEDGIPDLIEDENGNGIVDDNETDPNDPDTDSDGLLDGIEIDDSDGNTTDPLDEDTDGDFILDGTEDANGNGRVDPNETDPNSWDTDGDGISDLDDRYPLDPQRWEDPDDGNEGSSTILVLVVIVFVLLLILGYALYQKISMRYEENGEEREPGPGRGKPPTRRGPDSKR